MSAEQLTAILLAAIAAPGFWEVIKAVLDKLFQRERVTNEQLAESLKELKTDSKAQQKDIDGLKVSIQEMKDTEAKKEVVSARRRILKFNDELLRDIDHSKELFDDILMDLKTYEDYCEEHKEFTNGKTVMATENIRSVYKNCMTKHTFLQ